MQAITGTVFDVIYLTTVVSLGVFMIKNCIGLFGLDILQRKRRIN